MKSNKEIRQAAWQIVRGKWFWRLLVVGVALQGVSQLVNGVMKSMFTQMEIMTYWDHLEAKVQMLQQGLEYSLPSANAALNMCLATIFQGFVIYIFTAIVAFGFAGAAIKATKDDGAHWFADSFGGFKRPLEVAWLMALMNLKICLWSLLFIIPGIVAIYRYRQAWYLKNENPEWSAAKCLAESGVMMAGHKWQAFMLDLSYIWWMAFSWLLLGASIGIAAMAKQSIIVGILGSLLGIGAIYFVLYVVIYFLTGRAVFYKALKEAIP